MGIRSAVTPASKKQSRLRKLRANVSLTCLYKIGWKGPVSFRNCESSGSNCGPKKREVMRRVPRGSLGRIAAGGIAVAALHKGLIAASKFATSCAARGPETFRMRAEKRGAEGVTFVGT